MAEISNELLYPKIVSVRPKLSFYNLIDPLPHPFTQAIIGRVYYTRRTMHPETTKNEYIAGGIIVGVLSCIPLFFLPVTQDFYNTNKWILLVLAALTTVVLFIFHAVRSKKIEYTPSSVTLGLGSITLASLLSVFIVSPNKVEALVDPFGPGAHDHCRVYRAIHP